MIGVASALKRLQTRARGRKMDAFSGAQLASVRDIEAWCEKISKMTSLGRDGSSVRNCPDVQEGGMMLYIFIKNRYVEMVVSLSVETMR